VPSCSFTAIRLRWRRGSPQGTSLRMGLVTWISSMPTRRRVQDPPPNGMCGDVKRRMVNELGKCGEMRPNRIAVPTGLLTCQHGHFSAVLSARQQPRTHSSNTISVGSCRINVHRSRVVGNRLVYTSSG
jgi:hypothetical protein